MTIFEAYNSIKKQFRDAGFSEDVFEAKQIIKYITGYTNNQILTGYSEQLNDFQISNLNMIMKQRLKHYPLQYILGKWDFYGREYRVGPGVLIPRQDTETVIEICLDSIKNTKNPQILDLCAGTGCIGITLAGEREDSNCLLVEKYKEAAAYITENIKYNAPENVKLIMGDIFETAGGDRKYDLIVSNPPYISADEMEELQPEVQFEPDTALYGGEDGLMFYRAIAVNYHGSLKTGGTLVFEIGYKQANAVKEIMQTAGYKDIRVKKDISGNDRVVFGTVN